MTWKQTVLIILASTIVGGLIGLLLALADQVNE